MTPPELLTATSPAHRALTAIRRALHWLPTALGALLVLGCSHAPRNWVVYYGRDPSPEPLRNYDLVVVDSAWPGRVDTLRTRRNAVLAYISLGELNEQRAQFAAAKAAGLLLVENPNWKGAWMVDVRDERWTKMVLDEQAAPLLARGFDGFFLDTVESSLHLEATDPQRFAGMRRGVAKLIAALHQRYPDAKLLMNGALPILPELHGAVGMVAMESSVAEWQFSTGTARWRTMDERAWVKGRVSAARQACPDLLILTLDYWDPADSAGIARIYREQRADGFVPYVATLALDSVVAEPAAAVTETVAPR